MKGFMTGQEVETLLQDIHDVLGEPYGPVELSNKSSMLVSKTVNIKGKLSFIIGMKEIHDNPDKLFPIGEAMIPVVAYFHEVYGHSGQIKKEFEKETPLSRALALNYYACRASLHYYGFDDEGNPTDQYFRQPHEIAVQYMAIKCAKKCLAEIYGEGEAEHMLLSYVQYRQSHCSEYIDSNEEHKSVESVLKSFNDIFKVRVFEHREYSKELPVRGYQDSIWDYAKFRGTKLYVNKVSDCKDGVWQDMMVASTSAAMDPDERVRMLSHKALSGLDLEPDKIFSRMKRPLLSGPWKQDLGLERLDDQSVHIKLSKEQAERIKKRTTRVKAAQKALGSLVSGSGCDGPTGPGE